VTEAAVVFATVILATVSVGLVSVLRGPTVFDRMLAAQLLGTGAVAVVLLLAYAMELRHLLDVALVLVLLAAVASVAFVRLLSFEYPSREEQRSALSPSSQDAMRDDT
jgi:multicomponent Na+:H+ antiporter subunit F